MKEISWGFIGCGEVTEKKSGAAVERITNSALDELVVTDTIPLSPAAEACPKIRQGSKVRKP